MESLGIAHQKVVDSRPCGKAGAAVVLAKLQLGDVIIKLVTPAGGDHKELSVNLIKFKNWQAIGIESIRLQQPIKNKTPRSRATELRTLINRICIVRCDKGQQLSAR